MPCELTGVGKGRSAADAISDLIKNFDAVKYTDDTSYVFFLDVCRSYDTLPCDTILNQLQALRVAGRIFNLIEDFLRNRYFVVETRRITITLRKVTWSVTNGSVLCLLFLSIAIVVAPRTVSDSVGLPVRMTIYVYDATMRSIR